MQSKFRNFRILHELASKTFEQLQLYGSDSVGSSWKIRWLNEKLLEVSTRAIDCAESPYYNEFTTQYDVYSFIMNQTITALVEVLHAQSSPQTDSARTLHQLNAKRISLEVEAINRGTEGKYLLADNTSFYQIYNEFHNLSKDIQLVLVKPQEHTNTHSLYIIAS